MAPFCGRTGRPGVALDVGAKLQPCTALPSLVEVTSSAPLFPQPGPHPQSSFVFFQIPMHRMLLASSRIDATACLDCRAHCQARQLGVRVVLPECQAAILWTAYRYPAPARLPFRAGCCTPSHLDGTGKKTKKVVANLGSSRIAPFLEQSIVTNGVNSFSAPPPVCAPQYLAQRRASHVAAAPAADASPTFIATDPVRVRKPAADFGESCGCDSEFDSQPTLGVNVPAPEQGAERCGPTKGFEH